MSYAQMKKRFTLGQQFEVEHESYPDRCNGLRVVTKVQTNGIYSRFADSADPRNARFGAGLGSWCEWPKVAGVEIRDNQTIRFAEPGYDGFTYRLVEQSSAYESAESAS